MGLLTPQECGVTTREKEKVYLHILKEGVSEVVFPEFGEKIKRASFLQSDSLANIKQKDDKVIIEIPQENINEFNTVIKLDLE